MVHSINKMGNSGGKKSEHAAGVCVLESAVNFDLAHFKLPNETIYGELTLFSEAVPHGELQLRFELDYLPARPIHIPIHADLGHRLLLLLGLISLGLL